MKRLLFVILFVCLLSTASASLTRIYEHDTQTVILKQGQQEKVRLQLLFNTANCGGEMECFAVIKVTMSESKHKVFDTLRFDDKKNGGEKLLSHYILKNGLPYYDEDDDGEFIIKIGGTKNSEDIIDWVPSFWGTEIPEWAIWGTQYVYDNFDDSSLNTSLWKTETYQDGASTPTIDEGVSEAGYVSVKVDFATSGTAIASLNASNLFPYFYSLENMTIKTKIRMQSTAGCNAHVHYAQVDLCGQHIYCLGHNVGTPLAGCYQLAAIGSTSESNNTWIIFRNDTIFNNFEVYNNSNYNRTLSIASCTNNPTLRVYAYGVGSAGCSGSIYVRADYVYYTINNKSMNITLITPTNNEYILPGSVINFSTRYNTSNMELRNATLYIDGVSNATINLNGTTNSTNILINESHLGAGNHTWNMLVHDTDGNSLYSDTSIFFIYPFILNGYIYNAFTISGAYETFKLNITPISTFDLTQSSFYYNNTYYPTTVTEEGNNRIISSSLIVPFNGSTTNKSFFWGLTLSNTSSTFSFNTTYLNQTIVPISIDDCSAYSKVIANFSFFDEDARTAMLPNDYNNSLIIDAQIKTLAGSVISNATFNRTSFKSVALCVDALANASAYLDVTAQYTTITPDTYVIEYYNIQRFNLTTTSIPGNISLYPLLITSSQEFLITVKDENFMPLDDAVIEIKRRYVSPSEPITVEAPKTDSQGNAIGHFVLNDYQYDFVIKKDGIVRYTFTNMQPFCSNIATGDCRFTLKIPATGGRVSDGGQEITYDIGYTPATRFLLIPWESTDGTTSHDIVLTLLRTNGTVFYTATQSGISNSFSYTIPATIGNGTIIIRLTENDVVYYSAPIVLGKTTSSYRLLTIIGAALLVVSLPFMAIMAGVIPMMIAFIGGLVIAVSIGLLGSGGPIGPTSAIIWFIIAAIIIVARMAKR